MHHREHKACEPYRFETPLVEGIVRARPNRFIMGVELPPTELSAVERAQSQPAEREGFDLEPYVVGPAGGHGARDEEDFWL